MPRGFTDREQERIRQMLRQAAREIMGRRGVRKTTIDELSAAAGISKGSFYRFYPGKEALGLEMLAEWERGFHEGITARFRREAPRGLRACARQLAAVFLQDFQQQIAVSGLGGLFDPREIASLTERADPDDVRRMDEQDIRLFARLRPLLAEGGLVPCTDTLVIIAGLRMLFEAATGNIAASSGGPLRHEHYQAAFVLLIEGFLSRTFTETSGDG